MSATRRAAPRTPQSRAWHADTTRTRVANRAASRWPARASAHRRHPRKGAGQVHAVHADGVVRPDIRLGALRKLKHGPQPALWPYQRPPATVRCGLRLRCRLMAGGGGGSGVRNAGKDAQEHVAGEAVATAQMLRKGPDLHVMWRHCQGFGLQTIMVHHTRLLRLKFHTPSHGGARPRVWTRPSQLMRGAARADQAAPHSPSPHSLCRGLAHIGCVGHEREVSGQQRGERQDRQEGVKQRLGADPDRRTSGGAEPAQAQEVWPARNQRCLLQASAQQRGLAARDSRHASLECARPSPTAGPYGQDGSRLPPPPRSAAATRPERAAARACAGAGRAGNAASSTRLTAGRLRRQLLLTTARDGHPPEHVSVDSVKRGQHGVCGHACPARGRLGNGWVGRPRGRHALA
jgi:hypothetical protein